MFPGCVGFFLEFLEGVIFIEFLDEVRQIRFFLFDLFLFDGSCRTCRDHGWWGPLRMLVSIRPVAIHVMLFKVIFRGLGSEDRRYVHLMQTFLFTIPVGMIRCGVNHRLASRRRFLMNPWAL